MRFRFVNKKLQSLYTDKTGAEQYEHSVVKAFFRVMAIIESAPDTRDFYKLKSLHYEKLSGDRAGQYSFRLNKQWRLIVRIEQGEEGPEVAIIEIVDYH
ncbi:MAG: type II toxin-antitoxin system RelE/ParE family toxin [Chloroflexaceae bacterium]|nr:type II toxin-antitoxin system RelE/ParE family toxin [Chloroflexaceae bacterium]